MCTFNSKFLNSHTLLCPPHNNFTIFHNYHLNDEEETDALKMQKIKRIGRKGTSFN